MLPAVVGLSLFDVSRYSFPPPPTVPPSTSIPVNANMPAGVDGSRCWNWCFVVFCRGILSADVLPADPPSLPFRTVRDDVNFGLCGRFWLWVELPRSRTVLVAAYRLDGLPFYRRWSFTVCPAVTGDSGHRSHRRSVSGKFLQQQRRRCVLFWVCSETETGNDISRIYRGYEHTFK